MPINTDLNVTPYFDDFDEDKKFHKVLFRPSVPVQARELTQLQTILQNQVERFGDHIFKEGTIIKGCNFRDSIINYAKLNDADTSGTQLVMSDFDETYVRNSSNLIAQVFESASGFEATNPDLNTIFFTYVNTGNNSGTEVTGYSAGETLDLYAQNASINAVTLSSNTGTGYSNADTINFTSTFGSNGVANLTTNSTGGIVGTSFNNTASQGHSFRITNIPTVSITTSTGSAANTDNFVVALTKKNSITIANTSFEDAGGNTQFNPIGSGTRTAVGDGIIYQKGHFTQVTAQSIMIENYTATPNSVAVGFDTTETVANNTTDSSLNDNASGFKNENAPGAYRLKLTPTLVVNTIANAEATNNFFIVQKWREGTPFVTRQESSLSKIGDKMAKRTREESGDYIINPFSVGSEAITSNTSHLNITVGPGKGYVSGYRVETLGSARVPITKATTTKNVSSAVVTSNYGNYQLADELVGHFAFHHGAEVKLLDGAGNRISTSLGTSVPTVPTTSNSTVITGTSPSFTGNILGTAKIRSVLHEKNTPGEPSGQYRLYLFDISMNQGKRYQDVRSIWYNAEGIADVVLNDDSQASLKETGFKHLARPIGRAGIKTGSINGVSNNQFIYRTAKTDGSLATNGSITFTVSGTETFPYTAESFLNETQEKDWILVSNNNTAQTVSLTGTVAVTSGAGNVTGTSTTFTAEYEAGDFITVQSANTHRITSVVNNTLMVTANNFGASVSGKTHARYFPVDIPINLFDNAASNVYIGTSSNTVTINATRGKALHGSQTLPVHVYHNVKKTSAPPIQKTLATSFVKINCASHSATTTGTYSIGLPDVFDTVQIMVGNNVWWDGTTAANSTVVDKTGNFFTTTGQKDGFYGLGKLAVDKANTITLISTDRIVAKIRHFKQDASGGGKGFFNIDSYPVNDTEANGTNEYIVTQHIPVYQSPVDGTQIDLRNAIDFRPYCANTADQQTTSAAATINPAATEALAASDHSIAAPNKNFTLDYQYYMPRIDRVTINGDAALEIIGGIPGERPLAPSTPDDAMSLGVIQVPVYPTLSNIESLANGRPDYGINITSKQQRRYTMKDIGQIDKRINRLEYYSSLNMLEKQTKDLVIPAESNNAIDRFKQGFLVDNFKDFSVASVGDEEYKAAINKTEQSLVPRHRQNKIDLEINTNTNTQQTGDLVTLPYTHEKLAEQRFATTSRSAAESFWGFEGDIDLYPNYDNYYESRENPQNEINIDLDLAGPTLSLANALNQITSLQEPQNDVTIETLSSRLLDSTTSTDSRIVGSGHWLPAFPPISAHRGSTPTQTIMSQRQEAGIRGLSGSPARFVGQRSRITTTTQTDSYEVEKKITETESKMLFQGDTSTTKRNVGEFVTDISFSPFIREQNIHFHAYGLRANKRHYIFFDEVKMDEQTRPAIVPDGVTISRENFHPTGVKGANLVSDSAGNLYGIMRLAQGMFFVGERALVIADVDTYADIEETAISSAEAPFNAYNFSADKSDLTLTTRTTNISRKRTTTGVTARTEKSIEKQSTILNRTVTAAPPPPPPPQRQRQRSFCFIAGTKVIMDGHSEKNIEDIVIGDKVHRHDGGFNTVKGLQHVTLEDRKLCAVNGGNYFFTDDHPMMTNKGWAAVDPKAASLLHKEMGEPITTLVEGMTITGHNGADVVVETLTTKEDDPDTPVYNFEVDGNHEYFADGFLTHNRCFRAGTKVLMGDASWKLIEDVEEGEELVGKDGMVNIVSNLHRPKLGSHDNVIPTPLGMTSINGGGYDASEDHMFYTTEGWKTPNPEKCKIIHKDVLSAEGVEDIQPLQVGDKIVTPNGVVELTSIDIKSDTPDLQLYNFNLTGNKTYHVVMEGHEEPMLVHNKCFMAGTEMTMSDHSKVKVENIKVGDVLHGDGDTMNTVEEVYNPTTGGRKLVSINGSDYFTTEDHPFMAADGSWKSCNSEMSQERYPELNVGQIEVGDKLKGHLNKEIEVESIDFKETDPDTPLHNFRLNNDHTYIANDFVMHNKGDPIAQTFYASGEGITTQGTYVTKMDAYFKTKHDTLGITLEIRKTDNGYPSAEVIPFGKVHLKASEVSTSTDGSTATTFTFPSPVYLARDEEYCFVLMPDNDNPDYFVFASKTGGKDLIDSQPVNSDGFIGSLFVSSNDSAWKVNTDEDIKFTLYRAKFSQTSGTVQVQNEDYEYFTVNSQNGVFDNGEIVFQSNASAQTTGTVVISTSNSVVTGTGTSFNTEYAAGQYITFANSTAQDTVQINSVTNSTSLILRGYPQIANTTGIAAHHTVTGEVFFADTYDKLLYLNNSQSTNSTFKFAQGTSIIGSDSGANATIQSIDDKKVSHFESLLYKTTPALTEVTMHVHANTASGDSGNTQFRTNDRNYFKDEVVVKSKSNDLTGKWKQYFTLSTKDNNISPAVDLQQLSTLIYENLINNSTTNEHKTGDGAANSKYISRVVTLEDALDAEDLRVYVTAFKPGADNCDIKVYGKLLSELDTDTFGDRHWTELELIGDDDRSNDDNRFDYREYIYQIPQTPATTFVEKGQTHGNTTVTTASDITSSVSAGSLVKITNSDPNTDYQISTVASTSSTTIVLDEAIGFANNTGASIATVDLPQTAFKDPQNDKVVTYYNSSGSKFATYKVFAIKIVLLSDDISTVPAVKDYRAIALSV